MQTRTQYLSTLIPLSQLPASIDPECPICTEELNLPVAICPKHVFCQTCAIKWLTRKNRNTCPTCRRMLFSTATGGAVDRWPYLASNSDRLGIIALALERSGLMGYEFETYGFQVSPTVEVQRAAAAAHTYLAQQEEAHVALTSSTRVSISMRLLGPHIIAMANLLREIAGATGRPYSARQRKDWKMVVERVLGFLAKMDHYVFEGGDLEFMAQDMRLGTLASLREEGADVWRSRFFERDSPVDSPSGDLEVLLDYVVFQEIQEGERRARVQRAQELALQRETSVVGYALRWTRQSLFNLV